MKKLKNNNKGFSLVELLIVIAIMGVLAVIAFNMFGGVLTNSKKRADQQQAKNIEKAILTYCVDSGDWTLNNAYSAPGGAAGTQLTLDGQSTSDLIESFMEPIYDVNSIEYGPFFSKKDPTKSASAAINLSAYAPQWNSLQGGDYVGWRVTIYAKSQTVKVEPTKGGTGNEPNVVVNTTY